MSTHNIGFYEDLTKIIFQLSSNMHIISSNCRTTQIKIFYDKRQELGLDSAYPQNCFEWRGSLRGRLVQQASHTGRKTPGL